MQHIEVPCVATLEKEPLTGAGNMLVGLAREA